MIQKSKWQDSDFLHGKNILNRQFPVFLLYWFKVTVMDELVKNEILGDLYAYYGKLLTKNQQSYFEDYYYNDLSLGEIAFNHQVSRQAVYDNLRRCRKLLINYEKKLHMHQDYDEIEQNLTKIALAIKQQKPERALNQTEYLLRKMRGE